MRFLLWAPGARRLDDVQLSVSASVGASAIVQMVAPLLTTSPTEAASPLTVPALWALIGCSIFMGPQLIHLRRLDWRRYAAFVEDHLTSARESPTTAQPVVSPEQPPVGQ